MACNAHNHPSNCNCGWGAQWYGNTFKQSLSASFKLSTEFVSPEREWSFMTPNAKCPECGDSVYFYSNSFGSRVFFDDVGPPWPKHHCTNKLKITDEFVRRLKIDEIKSKYNAKSPSNQYIDKDGWKLFKVLKTKSFRYEFQHIKSGKKFEVSLLKDDIPIHSAALWIRELSNHNVEIAYFDIDRFLPVERKLRSFEARKYATMGDWWTFTIWFRSI